MSRALLIVFSCIGISLSSFGQNTSQSNSEDDVSTKATEEKLVKPSDLSKKHIELKGQVEKSTNTVKELYFLKKEISATYGGGTQTVTRLQKPNIYKPAEKLRKHYLKELDQNESIESQIAALTKLTKLNDRLISLSRVSNTKALEKSLKKIKDPVELERVLLSK